MSNYNLEEEGILCSINYMKYLRKKIKVLDLYYSYIKTPWPSSLMKINNRSGINYAGHTIIVNDGETEEFIKEKITRLKYKFYGDRKIYFNICPFHVNTSDTYAFLIDHSENLFYCLGCNIGGNNFDLLMEIYNITLLSATKILATISLLTTASSNEQFIKEENRKLGIPYNLTPDEWKIFFHLTRQHISTDLEEKAIKKREKILEKIDIYIEKQYNNGRLNDEIKQYFTEQHNFEIKYEKLLEKMSNRICVEKRLFKERLINRK